MQLSRGVRAQSPVLVFWSVVIALLAGPVSTLAFAQLGQGPSSVDVVKAYFGGNLGTPVHKGSSASAYTVHTITTKRLTLHEYISDMTGGVFAVSWAGDGTPNLDVLLGSYSQELNQAAASAPRSRVRSPSNVLHTQNLIIERFGHAGVSMGRACVSSELPEGVKCEQLR